MTVSELLAQWEWKPIRDCPGRYVLTGSDHSMPFAQLLGDGYHVHSFHCSAAKDTVLVVPLENGGLISYARRDGSLLHTLNTSEGFARKLAQLGISLDMNNCA